MIKETTKISSFPHPTFYQISTDFVENCDEQEINDYLEANREHGGTTTKFLPHEIFDQAPGHKPGHKQKENEFGSIVVPFVFIFESIGRQLM